MKSRTFGALVFCLLVAGCASGPKLADVQSAIPQLAPEQARIYFYRSSVAGAAIQPSILLNGSAVGTARPNGFFFVDVQPGRHEVTVRTEVENRLEVTAGAGDTRYVRLAVGMGLLVARFRAQLVDRGEAESEMAGLSYSGVDLASLRGRAPEPSAGVPAAAQPKVQTALAAPAADAQPNKALPLAGTVWKYRFQDRKFSSRDRNFSVQLAATAGTSVTETFASASDQQTYSANSERVDFLVRRIDAEPLYELAPYLLAHSPAPSASPAYRPAYPAGGSPSDWVVRSTDVQREPVQVPAGRFDAVRLRITGESPTGLHSTHTAHAVNAAASDYRTQRFEYTIWYVPEIGRYVQSRHQTFNRYGHEIGDEWVQLSSVERPQSR